MENPLVSSIAIPGVRSKISTQKSERGTASTSELTNEHTVLERDATTCSVRYNGGETTGISHPSNLGTIRVVNNGMRGRNLLEGVTANEQQQDVDLAVRKTASNDAFQVSRCGSWPGVHMDNIENLFEYNLNISTLRKSLESKDSGLSTRQRSSRFVETVSRTFNKRFGSQCPATATDHSAALKEKSYRRWIKLIKSVKVQKCTAKLLEGIARLESPEAIADGEIGPDGLLRSLDPSWNEKEEGLEQGVNDGTTLRSRLSTHQRARFRPLSLRSDGRRRVLTPVNFECSEFPVSAVVKSGMYTGKKEMSYGLVRLRYAGAESQVYDCIERETERPLAVKIIPKNHFSAFFYERLCSNPHPGFVDVLQILEDKRLLYILMDFKNGQYLSEFYQNSLPGTITSMLLKEISRNIMEALATLHRQKIVHGSIDMNAIVIKKQTNGKVEARLAHLDKVERAGISARINHKEGTFDAPELSNGVITCSSDLWSFGVILYMLIEGRSPITSATSKDLPELRNAHSFAGIRFESEKWMVVPEMKDFCLRCLQTDHRLRISSAMEALIHHWLK